MEKERLVNFIATIMEDSGFEITKNYKVSNHVVDIYATLNTNVGEVGVVVDCKNYEEPWKIGLDVLKDMEVIARATHASKIIIFTTSSFTHSAVVYAQKRNIKLVDRKGLIKIAKDYADKRTIVTEPQVEEEEDDYEYYEPVNSKPASLTPHQYTNNNSNRNNNSRRRRLFRRQSQEREIPNFDEVPNETPRYSSTHYLNRESNSGISSRFSFNIEGTLDYFVNHEILYIILLLVISFIVSLIFTLITSGPYTGIGRIVSCAIIVFGGMYLVEKSLSDVIYKGAIVFFIAIILSIITMAI